MACNNDAPKNSVQATTQEDQPKQRAEKVDQAKITYQETISSTPQGGGMGTYIGDKPCEDCETIKVILTLSNNHEARYRERKVGHDKKQTESVSEESSWNYRADNDSIIVVTYKSDARKFHYFKIGTGTLTPLDDKMNPKDCGGYSCTLNAVRPGQQTPSNTSTPNGVRVEPRPGTLTPTRQPSDRK
ncbi:MAG: copper resistance protein NlpE N-terminal domain-containing protein [Flavobacteriales bacterium]